MSRTLSFHHTTEFSLITIVFTAIFGWGKTSHDRSPSDIFYLWKSNPTWKDHDFNTSRKDNTTSLCSLSPKQGDPRMPPSLKTTLDTAFCFRREPLHRKLNAESICEVLLFLFWQFRYFWSDLVCEKRGGFKKNRNGNIFLYHIIRKEAWKNWYICDIPKASGSRLCYWLTRLGAGEIEKKINYKVKEDGKSHDRPHPNLIESTHTKINFWTIKSKLVFLSSYLQWFLL